MKHHKDNPIEEVLGVLKSALVLYYEFKGLLELTEPQREAVKELVKIMLEDD